MQRRRGGDYDDDDQNNDDRNNDDDDENDDASNSNPIKSYFNALYSTLLHASRTACSTTLKSLDYPHSPSSLPKVALYLSSPSSAFHFLASLQSSHPSPNMSDRPRRIAVAEVMAETLVKRLEFHFGGDFEEEDDSDSSSDDQSLSDSDSSPPSLSIKTNQIDRPEWFYNHLKAILDPQMSFLDSHLQPLIDLYFNSPSSPLPPPAISTTSLTTSPQSSTSPASA